MQAFCGFNMGNRGSTQCFNTEKKPDDRESCKTKTNLLFEFSIILITIVCRNGNETNMTLDNTFEKRALTIIEAAEYACVSRATIENWITKGLLPFEELPSRGKGAYCFRRIRKNDLDIFINKFYNNDSAYNSNKNNKIEGLFLLPRNT